MENNIPAQATENFVQTVKSSKQLGSYTLALVVVLLTYISVFLGSFISKSSNILGTQRSIVVSGSAKKSFETQKARITFVYVASGADRNALRSSGSTEFSVIVNRLNQIGINSLEKNSEQVIPLSTGFFEYRSGGIVEVEGQDKIANTISYLSTTDAVITLISYLPIDPAQAQKELFEDALADATSKARVLAELQQKKLGKVTNVTEAASTVESGSQVINAVQPGVITSDLQKSLSVTFSIR